MGGMATANGSFFYQMRSPVQGLVWAPAELYAHEAPCPKIFSSAGQIAGALVVSHGACDPSAAAGCSNMPCSYSDLRPAFPQSQARSQQEECKGGAGATKQTAGHPPSVMPRMTDSLSFDPRSDSSGALL